MNDIKASKEELDKIKLIHIRLDNCSQMMQFIPIGIDDETMKQYVSFVVDKTAESRWLEEEWWNEIRTKYNLVGSIHISFDDGKLSSE
jgi:hypothetical protein